MWLELKEMFTVISIFLMMIVFFQTMSINILFPFLLLMSLLFIILGDILIGWKITKNHLIPLIDPVRPDEEVCVLFDFGGHMDFVKVRKGPFGKREFIRYHKNASIINSGDYKIKCINGNPGFIGHEDYDNNVNLYEAEALDKTPGKNIKEIYYNKPHKKKLKMNLSKGFGKKGEPVD